MPQYIVETEVNKTGEHEIHKADCHRIQHVIGQLDLGECSTCSDAVIEAGKHFEEINGCPACSETCFTG